MKKKLLTLTLAFALVFTMAAPSLAATKHVIKAPTVNYLALGDSVAAGCKNMNFQLGEDKDNNPGFIEFQRFYKEKKDDGTFEITEGATVTTGLKNSDVYQVPNSFVCKVAEAINADRVNSYNGSYVGLRPLDICCMLDIKPYQDGDYGDPEEYGEGINTETGEYPERYLGDAYNSAMNSTTDAKAMNANTFTAETMYDSFKNMKMTPKQMGLPENTTDEEFNTYLWCMAIGQAVATKKMMEGQPNLNAEAFNLPYNTLYNEYNKAALKEAIRKADVITIELGLNDIMAATYNEATLGAILGSITGNGLMAPATKDGEQNDLLTAITKTLKKDYYYFDQMMKYIKKHKKDDAIVVVGTLIDPIRDYKVYDYSGMSWMGKPNADVFKAIKWEDLLTEYNKIEGNYSKEQVETAISYATLLTTSEALVNLFPVNDQGEKDYTVSNLLAEQAKYDAAYTKYNELLKEELERVHNVYYLIDQKKLEWNDSMASDEVKKEYYEAMLTSMSGTMMMDPSAMPEDATMRAVVDAIDPIISKMFPLMNKHIKNGAVTKRLSVFGVKTERNYYVADLSATTLNPPADTVKMPTVGMDGEIQYADVLLNYVQHPNEAGQKFIANSFLAQIKKAQAEQGMVTKIGQALVKGIQTDNAIKKTNAEVFKKAVEGSINIIKQLGQLVSGFLNK